MNGHRQSAAAGPFRATNGHGGQVQRQRNDLVLGFDFKPLSLGIEDVEEVCETSLVKA
jgi:hypothetical protein